jgi:hypothetical protein
MGSAYLFLVGLKFELAQLAVNIPLHILHNTACFNSLKTFSVAVLNAKCAL